MTDHSDSQDGQTFEFRQTFGFLRPKERAYLADEYYYPRPIDEDPPERPNQTKYRIQKEVTTSLTELLLQFRWDLRALHYLQRRDVEAWREWETRLSRAKPHLERLRDDLDVLIEIAERDDYFLEERAEFEEALIHLYADGDMIEAIKSGEEGYLTALRDDKIPQIDHLKKREEGLLAALRNEKIPKILAHLAEEGPCRLEKMRPSGEGEYWKAVVERELVPFFVEKTDGPWGDVYQLKDHGKAVLNCWNMLTETSRLQWTQRMRPDASRQELIREALELHELPHLVDRDRE